MNFAVLKRVVCRTGQIRREVPKGEVLLT